MALSLRNQAYISYPRHCLVKHIRKRDDRDQYMFEGDDPWLQKIDSMVEHKSPNLNKEYEDITHLSYDHNHIIK